MSTHTIGEVLNRLKGEFDDITISKIRFLEAEGLIHPDRTDSGYRKFTESDIDRLRYVLRAQRDRYLPLKVIKEELERLDGDGPDAEGALPAKTATATVAALGAADAERLLDGPLTDVAMDAGELAAAGGVRDEDIAALRDHGVLGDGPTFDGDDLVIVKLAAELFGSGLEARHLRMYHQFADREAALVEQLVAPLLRQRNPESRRAATQQAERVAAVGGELRRVLLARQLRALLHT